MTKKEVFNTELNYIKNKEYKESAEKLLQLVPNYFFSVAASSTGKYHPSFSGGAGGLVRHTKVALAIAYDVLSLDYMKNIFTDREKDLMIVALMFHDTLKHGKEEEKYTRFDHPLIVAEFFKDNKGITNFSDEDIEFMKDVVSSHMGEWNSSNYSDAILPIPDDKYKFFVHMCDYLSSRKYLDVKFDERGEIIK